MLLALAALAASPARATTFVGLTERRVVARAEAAVLGRVVALEARAGCAETLAAIAVDEVLRGLDVPPTVWVRLPGGESGGVVCAVEGAPRVAVGDRVLALLARERDGLAPVALGLGWYRVDGDVARRALDDAALLLDRGGARRRAPRAVPLGGLRARLAGGGPGASVGAAVAATAARRARPGGVEPRFAYGAVHARWFEPDRGEPVQFDVDGAGDRTLGLLPTLDAVRAAMAAWSAAPGTALVLLPRALVREARHAAPGAGSVVVFNDPHHEIPRPVHCTGILAFGGFRADVNDTQSVGGASYARILAGRVTFAAGWGRCRFWRPVNVSEVATHELGHAVGLVHSADPDAVMFPRAHLDERGPRLSTDDVRALARLYPTRAGVPPDRDGDGVPDARDDCPSVWDPAQQDQDGDGVGDLCDRCPTIAGSEAGPGPGCGSFALRRLELRYGAHGVDLTAHGVLASTALATPSVGAASVRVAGGDALEVFAARGPSGDARGDGVLAVHTRARRAGEWALDVRARHLVLSGPPPTRVMLVVSLWGAEFSVVVPCASAGRVRLLCPPNVGRSRR